MYLTESEVCDGFRHRLELALKEKGLTSAKVAEGIRRNGISLSDVAVRKWISEGRISEHNLLALSEFLDTTPWALRYGITADEPKDRSLTAVSAQNVTRRTVISEIMRSHDRLEAACRLINAVVWEYDLIAQKLVISGHVEAIFGGSVEDIGLNNPDDLLRMFHPQDRRRFTEAWTDALKGVVTQAVDVRVRWHEYDEGRDTLIWLGQQQSKDTKGISIIGVCALDWANKERE